MSDKEDVRQPERLSPNQVKEILARAVAIDSSQSESLSLDDLRAVADEAGISQSALAAAMREVSAVETAPPRLGVSLLLHRRVSILSVSAIALSILIVFMWLVPGIVQRIAP